MNIYSYYIRHENDKNWSKLSLTTRILLPDSEAQAYINQYASDRDKNPADYSLRAMRSDGVEFPYRVFA